MFRKLGLFFTAIVALSTTSQEAFSADLKAKTVVLLSLIHI